jgi:hypothetical protein
LALAPRFTASIAFWSRLVTFHSTKPRRVLLAQPSRLLMVMETYLQVRQPFFDFGAEALRALDSEMDWPFSLMMQY